MKQDVDYKMKKILIIIMCIAFIGLVVGVNQITKTISLGQADKDYLKDKLKIGKIPIINETCTVYNETIIPDETTYLNETIKFNRTIVTCLETDGGLIGYNEPIISPCEDIDGYNCKSHIYQKDGINKDILINYKFCEEYEIEFFNGSCTQFNILDECVSYELLNKTTGVCKTWKTLNQNQIENEVEKKVKKILKDIIKNQKKRDSKKNITSTELTDEIKIVIE